MKTIARLLCLMFVCVFFNNVLCAQNKQIPGKELVGTWSYTFEHPMEGTVKGVCEFVEKKNQVSAIFKNGSGSNQTIPLRLNDNGKYYADMESQGYTVTVSFKPDNNKMKCEMDAGVMIIPVEMERTN